MVIEQKFLHRDPVVPPHHGSRPGLNPSFLWFELIAADFAKLREEDTCDIVEETSVHRLRLAEARGQREALDPIGPERHH